MKPLIALMDNQAAKIEDALNSPANWRVILKVTAAIVAVSILTMVAKYI